MQRIAWNGWLIASVVLGASYWLVAGSLSHGALLVAWKGSGVALLAAAALMVAMREASIRRDAGLLTAVMAFGALGDVVLDYSQTWGAVAFLAGHWIAVVLYLRNFNRTTDFAYALPYILISTSPLLVGFWTRQPGAPIGAQAYAYWFYAAGLAAMGLAALRSNFPHRVKIGACMFVASDMLIFARMGPLAGSAIPGLLIWPLYYFGQFLICTGVLAGLNRRSEA